ncbi:hypothetical protein AF91_02280 [Lacticaseibacillus paracasei N1115]|uniref:Uncharacterized protein n=1 Tax=Lacticaseibacillus paracasei N1115 TaxID=1446494 RepID=A0A806LBR0_LACPA|nr:hypothetical protein AF91_02280 [Lacticaseibacillus paracasei N1115]
METGAGAMQKHREKRLLIATMPNPRWWCLVALSVAVFPVFLNKHVH